MTADTPGSFQTRHIGPDTHARDAMLRAIGVPTLDALIEQTIPPGSEAPDRSTCRRPIPSMAICAVSGISRIGTW